MQKKLLFCLLFICCFGYQSKAQGMSEKGFGILNLERHQFTFGSGFRYEIGLFRNVSASVGLLPSLGAYKEGYTLGLALDTRVRYYLNFQERLDINKNVTGNSANYLGLARSVFFGALQLTNNITGDQNFNMEFFGGVYGIQRTYRSGFNINAELGAGYYLGNGVSNGYGALFTFSIGWSPKKGKIPKPIFN